VGRIPASRVRIPPSPSWPRRLRPAEPASGAARAAGPAPAERPCLEHCPLGLRRASDAPERRTGSGNLLRATPEGWQSGRMRRSRKPFRAVRSDEGSNPSPSVRPGRNPSISRGFGASRGRLPLASVHRLTPLKTAGRWRSLARNWRAPRWSRPRAPRLLQRTSAQAACRRSFRVERDGVARPPVRNGGLELRWLGRASRPRARA
jgi:hypothetical protein